MVQIISSHGNVENVAFVLDERGRVLEVSVADTWDCPLPVSFDTKEFIKTYGKLDEQIDILDIGYTDSAGKYIEPEREFRIHVQGLMQRIETESY